MMAFFPTHHQLYACYDGGCIFETRKSDLKLVQSERAGGCNAQLLPALRPPVESYSLCPTHLCLTLTGGLVSWEC
jgi:hypothetical protein